MDHPVPDDTFIAGEILRQVQARGFDRSICPSEVARALSTDWHPLMSRVRLAAVGLARLGRIDILRKGRPIDPEAVKGVIRLRLAHPGSSEHEPNE